MLSDKFISATKEFTTEHQGVPAPYIRKTFEVSNFKNAEIYVCGLGFYEFYVNGKEITKGKLAPYISNPDQVVYYDRYDLTNLIKQGKNAFGFLLGNGFLNNPGGKGWLFDQGSFRSAPKLAIAFIVDGKVVFEADTSFKTAPSPIIFDDYRMGEHYDAQKEIDGWAKIDFDDSKWANCIEATTPKGEKRICTANPIKVVKEIKPVRKWRTECGNVYDFGANFSGVVRLKLDSFYAPHQRFKIHHAEVLLEDTVIYKKNICVPFRFNLDDWQTDIYYAKDDCFPQIYQPHFTYHGFRYVFIEGIDGAQATDDLVTMLVYCSDFENQNEFICDNPVVNKIQQMTVNSDVSNFHYFPTDCPHREKNGWMGDIALSAEQLFYNFGCKKDLREWLNTVRKAQREDGAVPGIVPTGGWGFAWGNGPVEDFAITELPYYDYMFNGDKSVILDNADMIKKYVEYLKTIRKENGLFEFGLPDWCEAKWKGLDKPLTNIEITDSLVIIDMLKKAEKMFIVIGDNDYAKQLNDFAQSIREDFRKVHLDENLFVKGRKQTAQARAIDSGIFTDEEKKTAVKNLVQIIKEDGNRFQTGVAGARVLFHVLADNGYPQLAFDLITQDKYPSYGFWAKEGYDNLPERFFTRRNNSPFPDDGLYLQSLNHHFWGFVSGWFYKYLCGLNVNPDYTNCNKIVISPLAVKKVKKLNCKFENNGKQLEYSLVRKGKKVNVTITKNTGFDVEIK